MTAQPDIDTVLAKIEEDHAREVARLRRTWAIEASRADLLQNQCDELQKHLEDLKSKNTDLEPKHAK